jgi:hypothetical protein
MRGKNHLAALVDNIIWRAIYLDVTVTMESDKTCAFIED